MPDKSKRKKYIPPHKRFPKDQQPLRLKKEHVIRNVHFMAFPNMSLRQCSKLVNGVFKVMGTLLSQGMTITITNFGTFKIQDMAPRLARNPKTGEQLQLGPARRVTFIAAPKIIDKINPAWIKCRKW